MKNPKNILITGASSGIGEALSLFYAEAGRTMFLCARNEERLNAVAERCRQKGASVYAKVLDVTDEASMRDWIFDSDEIAPLDLVIANAGVSAGPGGPEGETEAQTRQIFSVNVGGVLNTVLPAMQKLRLRKSGQIAVISSLAGYRGLPSAPAYSGSKNAIRAWGEALRGWLAPEGIEVNVVCPGFVASRITEKNKFPMPFFMQADKAAKIIAKGLSKNKGRITFPFPLAFASWLTGAMPSFIADVVLTRLPKKGA